jgi:16S rRNA G966 N2-methylase RsmD
MNDLKCKDDPHEILNKIINYKTIIEKRKNLITFGTYKKTDILKSNYDFIINGTNNIKLRYFSDFFQYNIRKKCKRKNGMSIEEFIKLNNKKIEEELDKKNLEKSLCNIVFQANIMALDVCDNFDVTIARYIYLYFKSKNVLDFCAGWGDRLIGAISCDIKYTGIDINTDLFIGYGNIIKTIAKNNDSKYIMINSPAESANIPKSNYDLIFTSPPYFSSEIYSDKEENINKYNSDIISWLNNFMIPAIKNSYQYLIKDGYMIIGLNDTRDENKNKIIYTELLNLILGTYFEGCLYKGTIGFRYNKRDYINPLWIFQKVDKNNELLKKQKISMKYFLNKHYDSYLKKLNISL